jgi:glutathione synthase/RimK-type ligase-like ATP-grasp enzyme
VQLAEARAAGLEIPRTLSSNDPARIRAFLADLGGPAIYKAFYPAQWEHGNELAVLLTSEVTAEQLPPDAVLRLTPGIYQPKLAKRHELRVTVMGERVVTARLLSQSHAATQVDWRARSVDLAVEPDVLPPDVERNLLALMRRLGLVFGCVDLVVTPEGRHVFLEVNPMGQFLWIEHGNPDVRLLGPFCDFLAARGRSGVAPAFAHVRHADWFERANEFIAATEDAHVRWQDPYVVPDSPRKPSPGRSGAGVPLPGV